MLDFLGAPGSEFLPRTHGCATHRTKACGVPFDGAASQTGNRGPGLKASGAGLRAGRAEHWIKVKNPAHPARVIEVHSHWSKKKHAG